MEPALVPDYRFVQHDDLFRELVVKPRSLQPSEGYPSIPIYTDQRCDVTWLFLPVELLAEGQVERVHEHVEVVLRVLEGLRIELHAVEVNVKICDRQ